MTVLKLFSEQVKMHPEKTSVLYKSQPLTYRELDEQSTQLANYLKDTYNVEVGDHVGVLLNRSKHMVITLLGMLKCGAAFVPIDPETPAERQKYIIKDAKISLLITEMEFLSELEFCQCKLMAIDVENEEVLKQAKELVSQVTSDTVAYILYTSGSTGKPKGCLIQHGSLYNYLLWANKFYFDNSGKGNFGLFTSLSFDFTLTSIFCPLTKGGLLTVFDQSTPLTNILTECFSEDSPIDTIKLTPSHLQFLENSVTTSKNITVILGGEVVKQKHLVLLEKINKEVRVFNEYGPTEATIGCIATELDKNKELVVIGKPIDNVEIYILNKREKLCPIGMAGEIYITGKSLAKGYLERPELTAEKFLPNPFRKGQLMYKTGDSGKWLRDGNIQLPGKER
jgi:amino acid adenylation domain-containing protein